MDRREKHRFYTDDAQKRIKYLESETDKLRKEAVCSKQVIFILHEYVFRTEIEVNLISIKKFYIRPLCFSLKRNF